MKKLIIRADDLGYSKAVNYGIYESIVNGIVNNVCVMVNTQFSEHGIELVRNTKADLGLHTVICTGKPITAPDLVPSLTTKDGMFKTSKTYRNATTDFVVFDEVVLEIEAQYQKFVELTGSKPVFLGGHAVASSNFIKGLQLVARLHNVPFLGFSGGTERLDFKKSQLYPLMESMSLHYDPFETMKKAFKLSSSSKIPMIICHPGYLDSYLLANSSLTIARTKEVEMLCSPKVKADLEKAKIQLLKLSKIV
ncbi:cellobiose phosphotransferase system YdjC-like protein [Liquorilactobacillus sucicola DSM 21376 = JCM 15457]|nr:ChbG/HpnK family deacetylase [Liquorilactobacillus sucicola]GAJ26966.1 cellobiose phosphotransferase system YdjC-like protein [Liquorilactobacillus sucicola DSM 21376 = JCM 15457]